MRKAKSIITAIYNRMLYSYCWLEVFVWQMLEKHKDYQRNVNWVKKNGPLV